jgi:hypothetical protein
LKLSAQEFAEIVNCLRARAPASSTSEMRRSTRMDVSAKVDIFPLNERAEEQRSALARDISMEGIGLLTTVSPQVGTKLIVILSRDKAATSLILCNVMFCGSVANGIFKVGCQFDSHMTAEQFRLAQEKSKAALDCLRQALFS